MRMLQYLRDRLVARELDGGAVLSLIADTVAPFAIAS
jgi:hypothetical protein